MSSTGQSHQSHQSNAGSPPNSAVGAGPANHARYHLMESNPSHFGAAPHGYGEEDGNMPMDHGMMQEQEPEDTNDASSNSDEPAKKRRRSRKGLGKRFECSAEGCGKSYSRAEHFGIWTGTRQKGHSSGDKSH
ncbi:hypothetical protein ACCO45_011411 [Purpureocillium lilacinum]|uniref:Uncharacterized protein n=1 Tax=Purpureocillium lilacinum TaxID=33203 RepID=A0ACC4DAQ7_PURLI